MAQNKDFDYNPVISTEPLSKIINRHFKTIVPAGVYEGLYVTPGTQAGKYTAAAGVLCTKDGMRIEETVDRENVFEPDPNNDVSGYDRWDALVLRASYEQAYPPGAAYFDVVQGTPAENPERPELPDDAHVLAWGLMRNGASEYEYLDHPFDSHLSESDWPTILVGDGQNFTAPKYNGADGLEDAIDDWRDFPVVIRPVGAFMIDGGLSIHGATKLRGFGLSTFIGLTGSIATSSFSSSGGATQAGTNILAEAAVDFRNFSQMDLIQITTGSDAGLYRILEKRDGEVVLDLYGETFTGESVSYKLWKPSVAIENCAIEIDDTGQSAEAIDLRQCKGARVVDCRITGTGLSGIYSTDNEELLIDHCRIRGTWVSSRAIRVEGDHDGGRVVDNDCGSDNIYIPADDVYCSGNVGIIENGDGAPGAGVGDDTYPFNVEHLPNGAHQSGSDNFNVEHNADGSHMADIISASELANNAVGTDHIQDDAVTIDKIANDAVFTLQLADGAVTANKILNGEVTEAKIADNAVTADKIASGAVSGAKIAVGGVQHSHLAANAVETDNILDAAVTQAKLFTRLSAQANLSAQASIPDNTATVIDFDNVEWDEPSGGRITTGASWKFTADRNNMRLRVTVGIKVLESSSSEWDGSTETISVDIFLSGGGSKTLQFAMPRSGATDFMLTGSRLITLDNTEYFQVKVTQTSGASQTLATDSHISIEEV